MTPLIPDKGPDIVERLRAVSIDKNQFETISLLSCAADLIVSLRHALECIIVNEHHMTTSQMADLARGALKDKQP